MENKRWRALGEKALRYLWLILFLRLLDRLFPRQANGLLVHVVIAFIVLDGRNVWRALTGHDGFPESAAPQPWPSGERSAKK